MSAVRRAKAAEGMTMRTECRTLTIAPDAGADRIEALRTDLQAAANTAHIRVAAAGSPVSGGA